jgi:endonuclease-3
MARPVVTLAAETFHDPFRVLVSTVLSLRTQDKTTEEASRRLFQLADNPRDMLKLSAEQIEKKYIRLDFIEPRQKRFYLCQELTEKYGSKCLTTWMNCWN